MTAVQVESNYLEVLARSTSAARIETNYLEVALRGTSAVRVETHYLEVMTLVNPPPVTAFVGWGIPI